MARPSSRSGIEMRQREIADIIRLQRIFKQPIRRLRSLPLADVRRHWWDCNTITISYEIVVPDLRMSAKYLEKFANIVPLEAITSKDTPDGSRVFEAELIYHVERRQTARLQLSLTVRPVEEEAPNVTCRKVLVGMDTETITRSTPRYQLVCD